MACAKCKEKRKKKQMIKSYVPISTDVDLNSYNSFPSLINGSSMPPNGGWSFKDYSTGREVFFTGHSANDVLSQVINLRKNNNKFTTIKEVQYELDYYWFQKTPDRYPKSWNNKAVEPAQLKSVEEAAEPWGVVEVGPIIWEFLNLYVFHYDQEQFLNTVKRVGELLDPDISDVGCKECSFHWNQILRLMPPEEVTTREEAIMWVYNVHNRVNDGIGKKFFKKEEFKKKYGVELP